MWFDSNIMDNDMLEQMAPTMLILTKTGSRPGSEGPKALLCLLDFLHFGLFFLEIFSRNSSYFCPK